MHRSTWYELETDCIELGKDHRRPLGHSNEEMARAESEIWFFIQKALNKEDRPNKLSYEERVERYLIQLERHACLKKRALLTDTAERKII